MRHDGRESNQLRPIKVQRGFTQGCAGSVLIQAGRTTVLCTASIELDVPPWKKKEINPSGWVTAEYAMLPGSTSPRKSRERSKIDSRSSEIQRLIGRSLRAAVDLGKLGPRTIIIDCDVLEADGGTRTLSITGGYIALVDAVVHLQTLVPEIDPSAVICQGIAAISVGILNGQPLLDLNYPEDSKAEVDLNVVMTHRGEFIEIQGTAEHAPFTGLQLTSMLELAQSGIRELSNLQRETLGKNDPLDKKM
jgi:ribonuclease PH